jgi:hypothetical protein
VANPTNLRVVLRRRPVGEATPEDFELLEAPVPAPGDGEVLCRTIYLSLDPYMRGRMNDAKSYAPPVELGQVMVGGTVGEVVESRAPGFAPGDVVVAATGWQTYGLARPARAPSPFGLRRLDPAGAPVSTALGVLGMPGMTAWVGLLDIGRPKAGETVVVSAAAGAVGSIVGQIARIRGCRAVGIAGAPAKCEHVVKDLGFDACVSHRAPDLHDALARACPDGIDVYFDNVGGPVLETVLRLVNPHARVPLCGLISQYNARERAPGPNLFPLLARRVTLQGFIVSDHGDRMEAFLAECAGWLRAGRLTYREDIVEGLAEAPRALIGLLRGDNVGKRLVQVGPDPTRR